jgi:poly(3-hydroxybutyrate) depolymerase
MEIRRLMLLIFMGLILAACNRWIKAQESNSNQDRMFTLPENEAACAAEGWEKLSLVVAGHPRDILWAGPDGPWRAGAVIVLHGGGGSYTHWCHAFPPLVKPQVDFSQQALAQGFAVFLLDSTDDLVTDANRRVCGKRFDAVVVDGRQTNVDLPFIERVILEVIPSKRPPGSSTSLFMTGESTGGFMTVRASTHFDNLITAFAPAASSDPYGTYFDCDPSLSPRQSARGAGFDRDTGKEVIEEGACAASAYPREAPWESAHPTVKPAFKTFHHQDDGVVDRSCQEKLSRQLESHGYTNDGDFTLPGTGRRSLAAHLWQGEYNRPMLDFFLRYVQP